MSSSDYGLINNLLHQLGFGTFNFFTANRALFSVILTQAWQWTGWAMVIYLANLQSISPDLYEAADIDGAGGIKKFFYAVSYTHLDVYKRQAEALVTVQTLTKRGKTR